MGSKRAMLRNGLGDLLLEKTGSYTRFFDLFSGSAAVSTFVATRRAIPVHAFDLQQYARVSAASVVERVDAADSRRVWKNWRARAARLFASNANGLPRLAIVDEVTKAKVEAAREWCLRSESPITQAYGGHYFSPFQAMWIDCLRATVLDESPLELAALIDASSECAAAPGHTAQPFQPTATAVRHISEAWNRDVLLKTRSALLRLGAVHAKVKGKALAMDANQAAHTAKKGDLVFVDPPYSALQYSRFYHVLESIVNGSPGAVDGVGRYPRPELRPRSSYSMKSLAPKTMRDLLSTLAFRKADVILTFPDHDCSNGLSGGLIRDISSEFFEISEVSVKSRFSTLGGSGLDCISSEKRGARREASELILILRSPD